MSVATLLTAAAAVVVAAAAAAAAAARILRAQFESEKATILAQNREAMAALREREEAERAARAEAEKVRAEAEKAEWERRLAAMKESFEALSLKHLGEQSEGLRKAGDAGVKAVLEPLGQRIEAFRRAFEANKEQLVANQAAFGQAIGALGERTKSIGQDAERLARALTGQSKTQGNWGETVLENILRASGLREGTDWERQASETAPDGARLVPDVVVNLPNGQRIVVDSKVSLTAYVDYANAPEGPERDAKLREHVASVRRHVTELHEKNYARRVRDSPGYVLMFIPHEGGYVAAMDADDKLLVDAWNRHVIPVNGATLMLSLQIVNLLWQGERQGEHVREILETATALHDKFANAASTLETVGAKIADARTAWDTAYAQLVTGRGSFGSRLAKWKELGVVSNKTIPAPTREAEPR